MIQKIQFMPIHPKDERVTQIVVECRKVLNNAVGYAALIEALREGVLECENAKWCVDIIGKHTPIIVKEIKSINHNQFWDDIKQKNDDYKLYIDRLAAVNQLILEYSQGLTAYITEQKEIIQQIADLKMRASGAPMA
jgi:hypothetical protein